MAEDRIARYRRLLKAKHALPNCPMCSHPSWSVIDKDTFLQGFDSETDSVLQSRGIKAVGLVCTNCGYVRFHDIGLLEATDVIGKSEGEDDDASGGN